MRGLRLAGGLFVMATAAVLGMRRPWQPRALPVAAPIEVMADLSVEVIDTLRRRHAG